MQNKILRLFQYFIMLLVLSNCGGNISLLEIPIIETPPTDNENNNNDNNDNNDNNIDDGDEPVDENIIRDKINEVFINGEIGIESIYKNSSLKKIDISNNELEYMNGEEIIKFKISDFKDEGNFYETKNSSDYVLNMGGKKLNMEYADFGVIYKKKENYISDFKIINDMYDVSKVINKEDVNLEEPLTFTGKTIAKLSDKINTNEGVLIKGDIKVTLSNDREDFEINYEDYYTFSFINKVFRTTGENKNKYKEYTISPNLPINSIRFDTIYLGKDEIEEVLGNYNLSNKVNININGIFGGKLNKLQ